MTLADQIAQIRTLASQGKNEVEIATATGLEIGDVASVLGGGGAQPGISAGAGAGAVAGVPRVLKFPFAFDSSDLLTGHAVYTPVVGDLLMDAWWKIVQPWDVVAKIDAGAFASDGNGQGWWRSMTGLPPLAAGGSSLDRIDVFPDPNLAAQSESMSTGGAQSTLRQVLDFANLSTGGLGDYPLRSLPAEFVRADPIKVVVSSDGTVTGTDPGATQGQAVLYLVVATPATP